MQRLIDADALAKFIDYGHLNNPNEKLYSENDIREMIDMMPAIDAVPISFIEEQVKLCNEIGFRRGEECYMALIEKWRDKNGAETD